MPINDALSITGFIIMIFGFILNFSGPVVRRKIKKQDEEDEQAIKENIKIKLIAFAITVVGIVLLFI